MLVVFEKDEVVRTSRKAYERAIPEAFRTPEILEAAGARVTKTQLVAPLRAFRYTREDPEAKAIAERLGVHLEMVLRQNNRRVRARTLPAVSSFAAMYEANLAKGLEPDPENLWWRTPAPEPKKRPARRARSKPNR